MSDIAFKYFLPVNIEFGSGKVAKAGELTKPYGKKALIVTGHSSAKKSGLYDKVKDSLKAEGIDSVLFDKVAQNPLTTTAAEGAALQKIMVVMSLWPSVAEALWIVPRQLHSSQ